jgi:hypothetical protein
MADETLQTYESLRTIGPGIHCLDGDWYETAFRRRMTIFTSGTGELAIHSAIRMKEEDMSTLERLGRVAWILVPNRFHCSDAPFYSERYPDAAVLVPTDLKDALSKKLPRISGDFGRDWPATLSGELERVEVRGLRWLGEAVFVHKASRTLVLTDLAFNHEEKDFAPGMERRMMRWNRIGKGFAPSRAFEHVFVKDRAQVMESIGKILELDFDRIIVSHGRILETGGKEALRQSFQLIGAQ